jgi:hypothetical protein
VIFEAIDHYHGLLTEELAAETHAALHASLKAHGQISASPGLPRTAPALPTEYQRSETKSC